MTDLSATVAPKSDQLNSDDLIAGPRTITITRVSANPGSPEQPVAVYFQGDNGKPYKPCKSMRRVMILAWGADGSKYAGRSMTLYCDPSVMFGGIQVGGIRISHMSHIERDLTMPLTMTKARRAAYTVRRLAQQPTGGDAAAPSESVRMMVRAFERFGVSVDMIEQKLGHSIDRMTNAQLDKMRTGHAAIKAGAVTALDWFAVHQTADDDGDITARLTGKANGATPDPAVDPGQPDTLADVRWALDTHLAPFADEANAALIASGHLRPGQTFADLSEPDARNLLADVRGFIDSLKS